MSERERGFFVDQHIEPKRKRLEGIADKTIDLTDSPERAVTASMNIDTLITRVGTLQSGMVNEYGETRKGWQVARTIERLERGDVAVSIEDLPVMHGIREKYLQLKHGRNAQE